MKHILKWILVVGAILSGFLLVAWLIGIGQAITPSRHGMMYGAYHLTFGARTSYGGVILGAMLFLVIIGGAVLAFRSKPQTIPESGVRPDPLEICPTCGADLEQNWKHCPACGYDLS